MLFNNAELHNVSEIIPLSDKDKPGYMMIRVPAEVRSCLNKKAQHTAVYGCGVEIRLILIGEQVKITLQVPKGSSPATAIVYFGSIQAGWECCRQEILDIPTDIILKSLNCMDKLENTTRKYGLPFDPHVIRVCLQSCEIHLLDIEGHCRPPKTEELPEKSCLCYGSSITHGSLSIIPNMNYVSRIGRILHCDTINLGFAGSAHIEKEMADYIASRNDWDFATLEMGINVVGHMEEKEFSERVHYFINRIVKAHSQKWIFCIDIFSCYADADKDPKYTLFRNIVKDAVEQVNSPNVIYINGQSVLLSEEGVSADLVHPSVDGMEQIAHNLAAFIKQYID